MSFRTAARYRAEISLQGAWFNAKTAAAALLAYDGIAANIPSKILAPRFPLARHWLAMSCTYFSCEAGFRVGERKNDLTDLNG